MRAPRMSSSIRLVLRRPAVASLRPSSSRASRPALAVFVFATAHAFASPAAAQLNGAADDFREAIVEDPPPAGTTTVPPPAQPSAQPSPGAAPPQPGAPAAAGGEASAVNSAASTTDPLVRPDAPQGMLASPGPQPTTPVKGPWDFGVFGYVRFGYDFTAKDPTYDFVGRNNGFVLDSARFGIDGRNRDYNIFWRVSLEGASDVVRSTNVPIGSLSVRLRDAFGRWDPLPWLGVQVGQFKAPFQEEELRGTNDLLFATRAVGVAGVLPGRGFQTSGIALDRQLGVMLSPSRPIGRDVGVAYYLMVMNGNGSNQLLDDNGRFGFVGRIEVGYRKYVRLGGATFYNERTVGAAPNLYDETDLGITGDVTVSLEGLRLFGAVTRVGTTFPTVGARARAQLAYHGQIGYQFDLPRFFVTPAYRYATLHPWFEGGEQGFSAFELRYHTFGVRTGLEKLPLQLWINYTLTTEGDGRRLDNDRFEILGQVTF